MYVFRQLLKNPGFTAIAVLTLGLGIAGNVVIFSIFNGLYLRPFPFPQPDALVDLDEVAPKWNLEYTGLAYFDFCEWRAQNQSFAAMGAWQDVQFNFTLRGNPERVEGRRATHDLLAAVSLRPLLGRGFAPEEDQPGKGNVALVSYGLWKRLWGGAADVLGQTLSLDAVPYTIVGVLPPNLGPLNGPEVWVSLARSANDGRGWYLQGVGRLRPGMTLEMARQDLTRIHKAVIPTRNVNEITSPRLTPVRERYLGDYRIVTYVLVAAVAVVWFIACANVAGLMLARGLSRSKEISIRFALGGTRATVVRQLMSESLALSLVGGLFGICLGQSTLSVLVHLLSNRFPTWIHFGVDWRFALFCLVTTAVTAMVFGLIPALQMVTRVNLQGVLQASTRRATGSSNQRRSLNFLVAGEIALALVLMINAGLLLQAFHGLQKADPGFRAENVITYDLALPRAKYTNTQQTAFFENHLAEVGALPGVKAASAITIAPLGGHSGTFFEVENAPPRAKDEADPVVLERKAFPGYATAMGLTLISGRFFSQAETTAAGVNSVVVNETFAQRAWPKQDCLGKRIRYPGGQAPWMSVVGVVKDVKHYGFDKPVRPDVYLPYHLAPQRQMTIVVRSMNDPTSLLPSIRSLLQAHDPDLPLFGVKTMSQRVQDSLWLRRSYSWLFGFFAAAALTMALGGIYGVISYAVRQRTNEIGIRMALGAQRRDVLRLVLRHGMLLAGIGIATGMFGAVLLARAMRTLLVGVEIIDPLTYLAVPLLLAAVTLLACWLPARRATQVSPMVALREE